MLTKTGMVWLRKGLLVLLRGNGSRVSKCHWCSLKMKYQDPTIEGIKSCWMGPGYWSSKYEHSCDVIDWYCPCVDDGCRTKASMCWKIGWEVCWADLYFAWGVRNAEAGCEFCLSGVGLPLLRASEASVAMHLGYFWFGATCDLPPTGKLR